MSERLLRYETIRQRNNVTWNDLITILNQASIEDRPYILTEIIDQKNLVIERELRKLISLRANAVVQNYINTGSVPLAVVEDLIK